MKKYFSIFLAMIFVISAATPALADEAACATAEQGNVMLIDRAFVQDNSSNDAITYSGLTVQTSDDLNCTMEFVLQVDDNSYSIGVSGELEEYTLSSETVIHHGCLRGSGIYDQIWDCGLACTFATGPTASMSTGMALVTGYGNATFHVVQNVPLSGAVSFYLDATEVTGSVTVRVG